MEIEELKEKGVVIEEKIFKPKQLCGQCNEPFYLQVYFYKGRTYKVLHCKNCNTSFLFKKDNRFRSGLDILK
ncbi:MAG: hypothetical protein ACTSU2_01400 [Promethearchaeota archaeon]